MCVCIFVIYIKFFPYCFFVSNSQVIGCEDRLRNDLGLYCVGWDVKLYSIQNYTSYSRSAIDTIQSSVCLSVCLWWSALWCSGAV